MTTDRGIICEKCKGQIIRNESGYSCLQCGKEWVTAREKSAFYLLNQKEITADYLEMGNSKTAHKWQMSSGTLKQLLDRWGVKPRTESDPGKTVPKPISSTEQLPEVPQAQATPGQNTDHKLPPFPAFKDDWDKEVKCTWLQVYLILSIKYNGKEVEECLKQ